MLNADLTRTNDDAVWTLKLTGIVDAGTHRSMWQADNSAALLEQMVESQAKELCIDLTDVEMIDSLGLRLLLNARKEAAEKNISIFLKNPNKHLQRLFHMMQIDLVFTIEIDR